MCGHCNPSQFSRKFILSINYFFAFNCGKPSSKDVMLFACVVQNTAGDCSTHSTKLDKFSVAVVSVQSTLPGVAMTNYR